MQIFAIKAFPTAVKLVGSAGLTITLNAFLTFSRYSETFAHVQMKFSTPCCNSEYSLSVKNTCSQCMGSHKDRPDLVWLNNLGVADEEHFAEAVGYATTISPIEALVLVRELHPLIFRIFSEISSISREEYAANGLLALEGRFLVFGR